MSCFTCKNKKNKKGNQRKTHKGCCKRNRRRCTSTINLY